MKLTLLLCFFLCSGCGTIRDYREAKKSSRELREKAKDKAADLLKKPDGNIVPDLSPPSNEATHSNVVITAGQSWLFYLLGAVCIGGVVVCMIMKSPASAIACGIGAASMCLLPTFIEAIHGVLQGLVWAFNACLILGFISLVGWVGYKVFHHPSKKIIKKLEI